MLKGEIAMRIAVRLANKSDLFTTLLLWLISLTLICIFFLPAAVATPITRSLPPKDLSAKLSWPKKPSFILSSPHKCDYLFFSPDGKLLGASARPNASPVSVWETATGKFLRTLPMSGETKRFPDVGLGNPDIGSFYINYRLNLHSVAFSPDNKFMASGTWQGEIKLWDITSGKCLQTLKKHRKTVNCISFSPDGKLLASGSNDKTTKIWDLQTGRCLRTLSNLEVLRSRQPDWYKTKLPDEGAILFLTFSPNGKLLASAGSASYLVIWQVKTGQVFSSWEEVMFYPWSLFSFTQDGKSLITSHLNTIYLSDIKTGKRTNQFGYKTLNYKIPDNRLKILGVASPDQRVIATISSDAKKVNLWELKSNALLHSFSSQNKSESLTTLELSPDGHWLTAALSDNKIEFWPMPKQFWSAKP
jgi:WD40 repeat protein